jgi:hypothetical protein
MIWGDLGRDNKQALAQAIARSASTQTKLGFITDIKAQITNKDDRKDGGFLGQAPSTTLGSPAALAAATVLSSMTGSDLTAGLVSLNDEQLQAVVKAAEQQTTTTYTVSAGGSASSSTSTTFDTSPLINLINAAAKSDSLEQRARVFRAAAPALDDIRSSNTLLTPNPDAGVEAKKVADAMTGLLQSDPRGMIRQLRLYGVDNDPVKGQALSAYVSELVTENNTSPISQLMAQLRFGPGADPNHPDAYLSIPGVEDGGNTFPNERDYGYFVGSVVKGLQQSSSGEVSKLQTESIILGGVATLLGDNSNPYLAYGAPIVNTPLQLWLNYAMQQAGNKNIALGESFYNAATYKMHDDKWSAFDREYSGVAGTQTFS